MLLPIIEVKKLIEAANFKWLDVPVFVPPNRPEPLVTSIFLQDADQYPADYRNNRSQQFVANIEVQIFFKLNFEENVLEKRQEVEDLLIDNGWILSDERSLISDPDTRQVTSTFFVSKKIRRKH